MNKLLVQITQNTMLRQKLAPLMITGFLSGIIGSVVKLGWEIFLPARTPERNVSNPPQELLQQLGIPYDFTHQTYSFNDSSIAINSLLVHFAFTVFFGILYTLAAEVWPKIKLWQGAAYGLAIWLGFHVILLPLLGTIPTPFSWLPGAQPWAEHFSEISGHAFTFWVMELVRRDLKLRLTGLTDEIDVKVPAVVAKKQEKVLQS